MSTGKPMANYAAYKRVGDFVFMSGVVGVNPAAAPERRIVARYDDLPDAALPALKGLGYATGQLSVDVYEAPIVAQSWFVLDRIRQLAEEAGGGMGDVFKLVQYFRDLRHYPAYNRVRSLFFAEPPVSTVIEMSRVLPSDEVVVEVEATMYLPR